jgi:hypothetical protein
MPLAPWLVAAVITSSVTADAPAARAGQEADQSVKVTVSPWPCRLMPVSSLRSVIVKGMERSETLRRQCDELAAAHAVVDLKWDTAPDSQSHARTSMGRHGGVIAASVKLPPLGDTIVLLAHELQHVIEQTRGLDLAAEAKRPGSGVWQAFGGYETQAAVDVSRAVEQELRETRHSRK